MQIWLLETLPSVARFLQSHEDMAVVMNYLGKVKVHALATQIMIVTHSKNSLMP